MRRRLAALVLLALPSMACQERGAPPEKAPERPERTGSGHNVLLITIDTLRADHLGAYGYSRQTSPNLDRLASDGALFTKAYTHWPKTRGSMAILLTGRRPSQNGYSKHHPGILGFNPTLASVLQAAGYETAAIVDNPNVAAEHGYAKGFDSYRETWEEPSLASEWDRTRAITDGALGFLRTPRDRPFLLWLHYVNPHAPYTPPAPFDALFDDREAARGARLKVVSGFHGGIPKQWAVPGRQRLGYYVVQYDREIAAVDSEVGRLLDALRSSPGAGKTFILLTSDHGESLGEHAYFFDHGEDLFEPSLRVPLILAGPDLPKGRRLEAFVSTLDVMPTLLDAVKVSYPPDLGGRSVLDLASGRLRRIGDRLFAQNDRNLSATWTATHKLVRSPAEPADKLALFDLRKDPGENHDARASQPEVLRAERRELELYLATADREWNRIRPKLGQKSAVKLSTGACENLKALGYVAAECE